MNKKRLMILLLVLIITIAWSSTGYCQSIPNSIGEIQKGNLLFRVLVSEELVKSGAFFQIYFCPKTEIKFGMAFYENRNGYIPSFFKPVTNKFFFSESWRQFRPGDYTLAILSLEKQPLSNFVYAAGIVNKKTKPVIKKESTNVCPPKGKKDFNVHYVLNCWASVNAMVISERDTNSNSIWHKDQGTKPPGANSFISMPENPRLLSLGMNGILSKRSQVEPGEAE